MRFRKKFILASREGDIEAKTEIIREYSNMSHDDLILLIQEKLPGSSNDKRSSKSANDKLIAGLHDSAKKLEKRKTGLTEENKAEIEKICNLLKSTINDCVTVTHCATPALQMIENVK